MSTTITKKDNGDEVRVKVEERFYKDEKGRKLKETTTITTTISTEDGALSSTTKTEVKTECIEEKKETNKTERDTVDYSDNYEKFLDGIKDMKVTSKKNLILNEKEKRKFRDDCVIRHNELRQRHGAPLLKKSKRLEENAQKWADHLLKNRILQPDDDSNIGQNIAYKYSSDNRKFTGTEISDLWYAEESKYDYTQPGFTQATGHFTQMIWKDTVEIGVGVATDGEGTLFAVANYFPAGNNRGEFLQNVTPQLKT